MLCLFLSAFDAYATSVEFQATGKVPPGIAIELAQLGKPSWHIVPGEDGASVRQVVAQACGEQPKVVSDFLIGETLRLNRVASPDDVLPGGAVALVPFCLNRDRTAAVQQGDTLSELLVMNYGKSDESTLRLTWDLNRRELYRDAPSYEYFVLHLQPERGVILPRTSVFTDREGQVVPRGVAEIVMLLEPGTAVPLYSSPPPRNEPEVRYVRFVAVTGESGDKSCTVAEGEDSAQFDTALLLQRLAVESESLPKYLRRLEPAVVGIIDTGIEGFREFFVEEYFEPNLYERFGTAGVDDDRPKGNDHDDDVYGINFNNMNGEFRSYPDDPDQLHGTKIASLVLGGKEFLEGLGSNNPPIRLKIVNFSSSTLLRPFDPEYLGTAIDYLESQGVDIVNLSLSTELRAAPHEGAMAAAKNVLFVVAAGNRVTGGQDLANVNVYPAAFGGRSRPQSPFVLTVGAHNLKGEWAAFSNYSKEKVDLLAPGCAVYTRAVESFVRESGTSVATAIVSFAAGLVRALGEEHPLNIKHRLLSSVDVDDRLEKRAWSSGRLNIVKAISLSSDVIETNDGDGYLFGRLVDVNELRRFCDNEETRKHLNRLVKVRPNIQDEDGTSIAYWKRHGGQLHKVRCKQRSHDQSLGMIVVNDVVQSGPPIKSVRDIVIRVR